MTVNGKKYTERQAAGAALNKFATDRRMDTEIHTAGTYRGFELKVQGQGAERLVVDLNNQLSGGADWIRTRPS